MERGFNEETTTGSISDIIRIIIIIIVIRIFVCYN